MRFNEYVFFQVFVLKWPLILQLLHLKNLIKKLLTLINVKKFYQKYTVIVGQFINLIMIAIVYNNIFDTEEEAIRYIITFTEKYRINKSLVIIPVTKTGSNEIYIDNTNVSSYLKEYNGHCKIMLVTRRNGLSWFDATSISVSSKHNLACGYPAVEIDSNEPSDWKEESYGIYDLQPIWKH